MLPTTPVNFSRKCFQTLKSLKSLVFCVISVSYYQFLDSLWWTMNWPAVANSGVIYHLRCQIMSCFEMHWSYGTFVITPLYIATISLLEIWIPFIDVARNGNLGCTNEFWGCTKCHFKWKTLVHRWLANTMIPLQHTKLTFFLMYSYFSFQYGCACTKTTAILETLAAHDQDELAEILKKNPFSIATDGSNDGDATKLYPIIIGCAYNGCIQSIL